MKLTNYIIIVGLLIGVTCNGQNDLTDSLKPKVKSTSFYVSAGVLPIYANALANVEVVVKKRGNSFFTSSAIRVGGGVYWDWGGSGGCILATLNSLTGRLNNHFEFGVGGTYLFEDHESSLLPAANIGYRFQKPDGHFLFRTGIGFPEAIYLSFGF